MAGRKKSSTKAAAKKTRIAAKKPVAAKSERMEAKVMAKGQSMGSGSVTVSKRSLQVVGLVVVVLVAAGVFVGRGMLVVASVNGKPVWRWELIQRLESQAGAAAVEEIVTEKLISQEAAQRDIVVTDAELQTELEQLKASLEAQGQDFDLLLEAQGVKLEDVMRQVRLQKLVEQMVEVNENVSPEQIAEYIDTNAGLLPAEASDEEMADLARERIIQEQKQTGVSEFVQGLRSGAEVKYSAGFL